MLLWTKPNNEHIHFEFCDILTMLRWFFNLACLNSLFRWRLLERRRLVYHGWSPFPIVTILLGMNCLARLIKNCVMREVIPLTFCRSKCACQSWFMIAAFSPSQSASEYSLMCRDKVVLGGRSIVILQEIWQWSVVARGGVILTLPARSVGVTFVFRTHKNYVKNSRLPPFWS